MRDCLFRKGLVLAIIILFIGMSVIPSTAVNTVEKTFMPTSRSKTLYVGGSGEGNYSSIQDAVDNASDGDTVFVYNGTYQLDQLIIINVSIRLIGENKFNTILYGGSILINASEVEIRDFTFQNGIGIWAMSFFKDTNNIIISGNIFKVDEYIVGVGGVIIFYSNYSTLSDNTFLNCGLILYSYHNNVHNNTVNGKPLVYYENTSDKIIDDAGQVILIGCNNITIENLELSNLLFGLQSWDTVDCLISDNDLSYNSIGGLFFNSSNNKISGNIISNNALGLLFGNCKSNKISKNSFEYNGYSLFFIMSSCNCISYNNFKYSYKSLNRNILSTKSDNTWFVNYWNRPRLLPVLIWNFKRTNLRYLPYFPTSPDVDWWPAKQPNDINGVKSHWSTLGRTISGNRFKINNMSLKFLEQFPLLQTLLQRLGLQN